MLPSVDAGTCTSGETIKKRYAYIVCREMQFENVVVFSAFLEHSLSSKVSISDNCTANLHSLSVQV